MPTIAKASAASPRSAEIAQAGREQPDHRAVDCRASSRQTGFSGSRDRVRPLQSQAPRRLVARQARAEASVDGDHVPGKEHATYSPGRPGDMRGPPTGASEFRHAAGQDRDRPPRHRRARRLRPSRQMLKASTARSVARRGPPPTSGSSRDLSRDRASCCSRLLRAVIDFLRGFRALHFVGPCVTVFGSARFHDGRPIMRSAAGRRAGASPGLGSRS